MDASNLTFSVVVNTYNRARSLRQTLLGLRRQTYEDFEVIVVNGPSADDTEVVLSEFANSIEVRDCPFVHLSKSRNIGIAAAAGEIVAFIDDDAIPDPHWLEEIVGGYDSEKVAGVGGIVYDYTGYSLQYSDCVCDRRGKALFNIKPPRWGYLLPQGDAFVHLLGTNASFRKSCLLEIGGFDEEIEYYLDETDVCMRLVDLGYSLRLLPGAAVYHKFLASHLRNEQKALRKPFPVVKNKFYFALQAARPADSREHILRDCLEFADELVRGAKWHESFCRMTATDVASFQSDVDRAIKLGIERGTHGQRVGLAPEDVEARTFRHFPIVKAEKRRFTFCFVSKRIPPESPGGVGRFTVDLAQGFAASGHEVHLITCSPDHNRVDFEEGVWVHRLVPDAHPEWENLPAFPTVRTNLNWASTVHKEVRRICQAALIDLICVPIWDCEGLVCLLDNSLNCVLTLQTTFKTYTDLNPVWKNSPEFPKLLSLEKETIRAARQVHAISEDILAKVRRDYGVPFAPSESYIVPLGIQDHRPEYHAKRSDDRVRVLFVGRLEIRKGIDVLLQATERLVPQFPNVEFVIVGDDTIPADGGLTYRAAFEARQSNDSVLNRVTFTGQVSESDLYQHYADCDIFCAPARYESFGLVFVEAMAFAKPVVGCAVGGMKEVIGDGSNGFLALPGDVDSLVDCLGRLIQNQELRRQFGVESRRVYDEKFSHTRMIENTLQTYTEIIESTLAA
jgi:glycosyltransferase involved in cell wall biosynthesis/GT2 family glycosyltransferase